MNSQREAQRFMNVKFSRPCYQIHLQETIAYLLFYFLHLKLVAGDVSGNLIKIQKLQHFYKLCF